MTSPCSFRLAFILTLLLVPSFVAADERVTFIPQHQHAITGFGGFTAPIDTATQLYLAPGFPVGARYQWMTGWWPFFALEAEANFVRLMYPTNRFAGVNIIDVGINAVQGIQIGPLFGVLFRLGGGMSSMLWSYETDGQIDFRARPYVQAAAGIHLHFNYYVGVELGLAYRLIIDLERPMHLLTPQLAFSFRLGRDPSNRDLTIEEVQLEPAFAAYRLSYSDRPLGSVTIRNNLDTPLRNVSASLSVEGLFNEITLPEIGELAPGKSAVLAVMASADAAVQTVTESQELSGTLSVSYTREGEPSRRETPVSLMLHGRQLLTWDDTRALGSFVTVRDQLIAEFADALVALQPDGGSSLPVAIQNAVRLFSALQSLNIRYLPDPNLPYSKTSAGVGTVDRVLYPRELLARGYGDCDDLVALAAAALESIGVHTALLTVPGHILIAIDTGMSTNEALRLGAPTRLISMENSLWMPLEVTALDGTFREAWSRGIHQWQTASTREFIRVRDAWRRFPPNTLSDPSAARPILGVDRSETQQVVQSHLEDLHGARERWIDATIAQLTLRLADRSGFAAAVVANDLGILFAEKGDFPSAVDHFRAALEQSGEDVDIMINLGSAYARMGSYDEALRWFRQVDGLVPGDTDIVARVAWLSGALDLAPDHDQPGVAVASVGEGSQDMDTRAAQAQDAAALFMWREVQEPASE